MYEAIVVLPLIGAVIAGLITLIAARNRLPGEDPPSPHDDHAAPPAAESHPRGAPSPQQQHAAFANTHREEPAAAPPAVGSRAAELITTTLLVISCLLSWYAFYDVGILGHEAHIR
ncbi:MAG: NADH-quinone oxidoreductase subunit L, partial [Xanthobacteraceae bacterium]